MKQLSVIIVSYNVRYYLEQCLRSVLKAADGIDSEVIVIDNASDDASLEYLAPLFPSVRFMEAGGNIGFSRANNKAAAATEGKYLLFLNPDTIVSENAFADCLKFMESHPQAGMAGVCMLNRDGTFARESKRAVPTPFVSFCKMSGLCSLFPKSKLFGRYYLGYLDNRTEARIEVVSGAYMFVRGEAFRSVGGFDEMFFMYGEDIDLSYRIQQSGYENWYLPVRILHYKGESTNKTSYRYAKVFYNAMLIFFDKHYKGINFLFRWSVHLAVSVQTLLTYMRNNLFKGSSDSSNADDVWLYAGHQEHLDGLKRMIEPAMGDVVFSGESLPPKAVRRDYTLYDISSFGFGEILDNLADGDGASVICTFNPSSGIILTDSTAVRNG